MNQEELNKLWDSIAAGEQGSPIKPTNAIKIEGQTDLKIPFDAEILALGRNSEGEIVQTTVKKALIDLQLAEGSDDNVFYGHMADSDRDNISLRLEIFGYHLQTHECEIIGYTWTLEYGSIDYSTNRIYGDLEGKADGDNVDFKVLNQVGFKVGFDVFENGLKVDPSTYEIVTTWDLPSGIPAVVGIKFGDGKAPLNGSKMTFGAHGVNLVPETYTKEIANVKDAKEEASGFRGESIKAINAARNVAIQSKDALEKKISEDKETLSKVEEDYATSRDSIDMASNDEERKQYLSECKGSQKERLTIARAIGDNTSSRENCDKALTEMEKSIVELNEEYTKFFAKGNDKVEKYKEYRSTLAFALFPGDVSEADDLGGNEDEVGPM